MSNETNLIILITLDRMLTYIYLLIFFIILLTIWSVYLTYKINNYSTTKNEQIKSSKKSRKSKIKHKSIPENPHKIN